MTPLQKLPKNVGDLGKLIVAKGFKKLPKVQQIAQSGHTVGMPYQKICLKGQVSIAVCKAGIQLRLYLPKWLCVQSVAVRCSKNRNFSNNYSDLAVRHSHCNLILV